MCVFKDFLEKVSVFSIYARKLNRFIGFLQSTRQSNHRRMRLLIRYDTIYMPVAGNKQFGGISNAQR